MRALTVKQPFASLIMAGLKPVENRSWTVPKTLPCVFCANGEPPLYPECSRFPFVLWVHAARQPARDEDAWAALLDARPDLWVDEGAGMRVFGERWLGAILGSVSVTGCHHADECYRPGLALPVPNDRYCSRWAEPDAYHWQVADPRPLAEPVPAKGRLGLWVPPDDVLAALRAQEVSA